ncbi:MAG: hypothetical protein U0451_01945 [Candidatus Saccharimonadales bacterium]
MSKYSSFCFDTYNFDVNSKTLTLNYSYENGLVFTETYKFDFEFTNYSNEALDRALQLLFLIAGVSYFKIFLAPNIVVKSININGQTADFLNKTYQRGLGEFFYVNKLEPNYSISFPVDTEFSLNVLSIDGTGSLIGLGGGKDSLVTTELFKDQPDTYTWSLGHKSQLQPLVEATNIPHLYVERDWDKQLLDLKDDPKAYNGHIPISAIFAAVGVVVAILSGKRDVIVSNESSASEPNLNYHGIEINHQYSKSLEFEQDFQKILSASFGDDIRYFSALRPLSEVYIAEIFSKIAFDKYKDIFSSCNRAFTSKSNHIFWCGECSKCAFTFLALSPYIDTHTLEELFGGKNLLLDMELESIYNQLLGIEGNKPLECVGEIKESRAAMQLAKAKYPELSKYEFELPENYNYKTLSQHSMPASIFELLKHFIRDI